MISRAESEQFAEDDRRATEDANRLGKPIPIDEIRAILVAVAILMLLEVFAGLTLSDRQTAFLPVVILTALVTGGAYAIARLQQRAWLKRYNKALDQIRAERAHRSQSAVR